jgi:hypothetical protein
MRTGVNEEDDDNNNNNNNRNQDVLAVKGKNYRKSCDLSGPPKFTSRPPWNYPATPCTSATHRLGSISSTFNPELSFIKGWAGIGQSL